VGEEDNGEEPTDLLIRHDNVFGTEEEDARRRDFTINGLFYDISTARIIDHVGGLADLAARRVRMIGNPDVRLREDPVRILRAVRFAAKLGLGIDDELADAMGRHKREISRCAKARVLEETLKLFRAGWAEEAARLLDRYDVLDVVLPETQQHLLRLRAEGDDRAFFAMLAALDQRVREEPVTDAVLLGALVWTSLEEAEKREDGRSQQAVAQALIEFTTRLGSTRRTSERLRQIFSAQRHLAAAGRRGRRRIAPAALARRSYFPEALDLFEIVCTARAENLDIVAEWRERARHVEVEEDRWDDSEESRAPRRSRRRRRPRRSSEPAGQAPAPTEPPAGGA
jgi:poly(A) polymerase